MKVLANAKLNLDLSILGNCGGYHLLRSTVTTVDICDTLLVTPRCDKQVTVGGTPSIEQQQNIAYRAGKLVVELCNTCGVDIVIDKGIPYMSGMGGSSADGAGVLVAMCSMYGISTSDARILDIARTIGSDVTYLMNGGCAIIGGKGDDIQTLPYTARHFVVTTFDTKLDTGKVFALYDNSTVVPSNNALQGAVEQHYDYMRQYQNFLSQLGYRASMTGSGSAYFVKCSSAICAHQLAHKLNDAGFVSTPCNSCDKGVVIQ